MNIPNEMVGGILGLITLLLGTWINSLSKSIKSKVDQHEHDGAIARLDREVKRAVPLISCELREQLSAERFRTIDKQIESLLKDNSADHQVLKLCFGDVNKEMKDVAKELSDLNKCVALLSAKLSCDVEDG